MQFDLEIDIYNIEYFKDLVPFSPATTVGEVCNFQAISALLQSRNCKQEDHLLYHFVPFNLQNCN